MKLNSLMLFVFFYCSICSAQIETLDKNVFFECADPAYQFGHFTATLNDPQFGSKNTITVDNQSMPVQQKIEIRSVLHQSYSSDYTIIADLKSSVLALVLLVPK